MNELTTAQIENVLLDTGVVYVNYGELTERILAPTRGGNSFVVEQDVKVIERDGALGKEKGFRRVIKEDAKLTVRLMDISITNLQMALRAASATSTKITSTQDGAIAETEYLTNVTLVGTDLEGKNKIITLFNAMSDNGLSVEMKDKDEAVVEVVFAGHRDPTDATAPLYTIEEVETAATNLSGLAVSTGTLEPTFSGSIYNYGFTVGNAVTSLTVTPTGSSATWIKVNGTVVASGAASGSIALSVGVNEITVRVHQNAKTDIEYKIYVTREDS